jgi:hypothetical protein
MPATVQTAIAAIGIDFGKNSFHILGLDDRSAIVLRQKCSQPSGGKVCQHSTAPGRRGGLRRRSSFQSQA